MGVPFAIAEFMGMQYVSEKNTQDNRLITTPKTVVLVLLGHIKTQDKVSTSNYFASIITASLIWVGYCWISRFVINTPGYAFSNLGFIIMFVGCCWTFWNAIVTDPGFVPKGQQDAEIKEVRYNGNMRIRVSVKLL